MRDKGLGPERRFSIERDMRRMKSESRLSFKYKMQLDGLKILLRICRALNLNRNKSVEVLLRICCRQKSP